MAITSFPEAERLLVIPEILAGVAGIAKQPLLGRFDVVLMSEVLEHLNHPDAAMRNVRKHAKEGGSLILTTPTPACQIMLALGFRLRYIRGLLARRVREELILCTDDIPYIRNAGLGGYLFRHDAYWPHTLPRWAESFGFQCKRHYTIGWLGQQIIGIDSRLAAIGYPDLVFRHMNADSGEIGHVYVVVKGKCQVLVTSDSVSKVGDGILFCEIDGSGADGLVE